MIGSGYPHLEEAYRVAELLFPALGIENHRQRRKHASVSSEFATAEAAEHARVAAS